MPERGERGFRIAAGVMSAVFVLSAAVQWNDPDPLFWIAIYGAAAGLAALAAAGRLPWWPNLLLFGVVAVLTVLWLPSLLDARREAFTSFEMKEARDEAPRELGGLALVLGWSAFQTGRARSRRAARRLGSDGRAAPG